MVVIAQIVLVWSAAYVAIQYKDSDTSEEYAVSIVTEKRHFLSTDLIARVVLNFIMPSCGSKWSPSL